jgi:serine/threonine-protein kinase RsbT
MTVNIVTQHCQLTVQRETDVPQVVAATRRFCIDHGLSALLAAHVATSASELANNLWMHASHGGIISLAMLEHDPRYLPQLHPRHGVELMSIDHGPGIADVALALREGYSTGGGMGCGLPGVQRLMDDFHIQSSPGVGTRVRARKWAVPEPRWVRSERGRLA